MKHYNTNIVQDVADIFKFKGEAAPSNVSEDISLVYDITPDNDTFKQGDANNATAGTIFTTPLDRDFFITYAALTITRDATATSTDSSIRATIGGVSTVLIRVNTLTTTAMNATRYEYYPPKPIKVDRGTNIQVTNATANANISSNGIIQGFHIN